jgi:glycosyltransferase involved in cell wall biosynthesis
VKIHIAQQSAPCYQVASGVKTRNEEMPVEHNGDLIKTSDTGEDDRMAPPERATSAATCDHCNETAPLFINANFLHSERQNNSSHENQGILPEGDAGLTRNYSQNVTNADFDNSPPTSPQGLILDQIFRAPRLPRAAAAPVCYLQGTMIAVPDGEAAIETLAIGDLVCSAAGPSWPIKWIGRRAYSAPFVAANPHLRPIRIRAGAIAAGIPRRDLLVSPQHAMFIDGLLIPADALVNGVTIAQEQAEGDVSYLHIELERHDIILAEGAPSETFLDRDCRGMFNNHAEYQRLYPEGLRLPARYCAPRANGGEEVETVRRRLAMRANLKADDGQPAVGVLQGRLDEVTRGRLIGWARDCLDPHTPVALRILDNGVVIGRVLADQLRADLEQAGLGGRHGFEFTIAGGFSPMLRHVIQVQREVDGQDLIDSPQTLDIDRSPLGLPLAGTPAGVLTGHLDLASRQCLRGWAQDCGATESPVALQVIDNGTVIARVLANRYRPDLEQAGFGSGWHGFEIAIPDGLPPLIRHVIEIKREADGADLPGTPMVIEAADRFDAALEHAIAGAVAAVGADAAQDRALAFLLAQADQLLQQRADAAANRSHRWAHEQFRRRWAPQLLGARAADEAGRRALVVDERVPAADRDAGSHAILSHIRALQRLGYEVSFVAADEMAGADAGLAALGVVTCGAPFYASVEDVLRRQAECFDLVYLYRVGVAARYLALARHYLPKARILYSVTDLHHVRLERQAAIEDRPELLLESQRMRVAECMAAWSADAVLTHSTTEVELLRQVVPDANVHHVPWDVPLRPGRVPLTARSGLAFIGHYGHQPNQDAARWLVETVMPLVWAVNPAITCLLVGSAMPQSIRRLERPGVMAIGHVPDLAADVFDRVRLTVAPMRYGAGVKGKVLASLAAGVPCVMSEAAAEGLALPPALRRLIGQDAAEIAALICRMHDQVAANLSASKAGMTLIQTQFGADHVAAALAASIDDTHGTAVPAEAPGKRALAGG